MSEARNTGVIPNDNKEQNIMFSIIDLLQPNASSSESKHQHNFLSVH